MSQPLAPVQTTQDIYRRDKRCAMQIVSDMVSLEDLGFFVGEININS